MIKSHNNCSLTAKIVFKNHGLNMQNWQECALLLIEFQNEWLTANGKLYDLFVDAEQFSNAVKNAKQVVEVARQIKMNIIHSGLKFTRRYKELGTAQYGLRAAIPLHQTFLENSQAIQFTPPFDPQENEFVVQGRTGSSAFSSSNLDAYLRNNQIKTVFIMGFALHVCVESTLRAAHDLGYEVIVIDDASSTFNQEQKQYFLKNTIHHFGGSIKAGDFVNLLSRGQVNDR